MQTDDVSKNGPNRPERSPCRPMSQKYRSSSVTAALQTTAFSLPVSVPPPYVQTTGSPHPSLPHRLPPLKVSLPTSAWPQTSILAPISTQMDRGQTGNSDKTGTFRQVLDTNGVQTEETNCIANNEVEEIIILPDEERFQVKQEKEDLKLEETKEQENDTEDGKTSSECRKKRFIRWLRRMCCCACFPEICS